MNDIYNYCTVFLIPIALILVSAVTKKIVRGSGWRWEDFYLGMDLTLAAFSAAAVNVLDFQGRANPPVGTNIGANAAWYIAVCFFLYIVQTAFHQDWQRPEKIGKKQILMLGLASNIIGIGLLGFFIILKIKDKI